MNTSRPSIVIGVATLPERRHFFENKCLPSLKEQADQVVVYHDLTENDDLPSHTYPNVTRISASPFTWGDAGKFLGYNLWNNNGHDFYFFSCDDDLIYPPDYCERMIEWIEYFERKAVVSLHGSYLTQFPIKSYYHDRRSVPCLGDCEDVVRVIFPGTGCTAFHNSTVQPWVSEFKTRNMADLWFGFKLQKEKIPAIVLPHSGDYLTYNPDLPLTETIWGQENQNDFVQTALVNQFSLEQGFQLLPFPVPLVEKDLFKERPAPLIPSVRRLAKRRHFWST